MFPSWHKTFRERQVGTFWERFCGKFSWSSLNVCGAHSLIISCHRYLWNVSDFQPICILSFSFLWLWMMQYIIRNVALRIPVSGLFKSSVCKVRHSYEKLFVDSFDATSCHSVISKITELLDFDWHEAKMSPGSQLINLSTQAMNVQRPLAFLSPNIAVYAFEILIPTQRVRFYSQPVLSW